MILTALAAFALSPIMESVYRYPNQVTRVLSYAKIDESYMRVGRCFIISSYDTFNDKKDCLETKPNKPNYLIIGDSHAADLWLGLQSTYPAVNFLQATVAGCMPIIGQETRNAACTGMVRFIFDRFLPHAHLDGIIISARWKSDVIVKEAVKTANVARLSADRVIIFGPIVEYDQALPRILARAIALNKSEAKFTALHRLAQPQEIDRYFSAKLRGGPIEYVSIYQALCTSACEIWATNKAPLQSDNNHLTCEGSIELARKLGPQLFPDIPPVNSQPYGCGGVLATGRLTASAQFGSAK
jgi:hypothetical protein